MTVGKFDGDELMMIPRLARRGERLVRDGVISGAAGDVIRALANGAAARDVQTKLEAMRPKTQAPIQRALGPEVVPLQGHAEPVEIAPELAPALRDFTPGDRFIVANHRAKFTSGARANASEVSLRSTRRGPSSRECLPRRKCCARTPEGSHPAIPFCASARREEQTL